MNQRFLIFSFPKKVILAAALFLFFNLNLKAGINYVEPVQNAKYVSIKNNIIIGLDEMIQSSDLNSLIRITGSSSGYHSGRIILTKDKKKLIFAPDEPFFFNEEISVSLTRIKTSTGSNINLSYTFQTQAGKPDFDYDNIIKEELGNLSNSNAINPPSLTGFPSISVVVSDNPTPGYLFMSNFPFAPIPNTPYLLILNNDATPYFARQVLPSSALDFKKQPNNYLTYFDNNPAKRKFYELDNNYNLVDSFYCKNGYSTDGHELRLLQNGHLLLMSYDPEVVDMSVVVPGGNPNAIVIGLIIQELDENKDVVFQWRSWDHFQIVDAIHENLTASTVDCVHGNAIEQDNDNNIMISSRHLSEITKIDRTTGDIIWRLGGVHNQFAFTNDTTGFSYQHCIRRIANGNITLYDNGNFHSIPTSRAVEYTLDEQFKSATLVWEYRHSPAIFGGAMGSVQRLSNGNTLISWGTSIPTITEVKPSGETALELTLPQFIFSYRTFKSDMPLVLNTSAIIQGFYDSIPKAMNMSDTVTLYLRDINAPFNIMDSSRSVIDSSSLQGSFTFYNTVSGTFYVVARHRNSIETWSKAGGENFTEGNNNGYNFTSDASRAYGNNMAQVDVSPVRFAFYSGDVNQDGVVNLQDIILVYNDASYFAAGYLPSDVNGDNLTNLTDLIIEYNNSNSFVGKITP